MSAILPPADDLDRLMQVMEVAFDPAFGEAWTRNQVLGVLTMGHCDYELVGRDGSVPGPGEEACGFALWRVVAREAELLLIAVVPDARGRGLGRRLLEHLIETAEQNGVTRIYLEMREDNPAEQLYLAVGFTRVGRRPGYYRDGRGGRIDAITLVRDIG